MQIKSVCLLTAISAMLFISCSKEGTSGNPPVTNTTALQINVKNFVGNPVATATVKLYPSSVDWENNTNIIGTKTADANGQVKFTGLNAVKYYWYAYSGCSNNGGGDITTVDPLISNITNIVTSTIEEAGTLKFQNTSLNPYHVYINSSLAFDMNGGTTRYLYYKPTGFYTVRVLQISGYILTPTDLTYTGNLACGGTLTATFP